MMMMGREVVGWRGEMELVRERKKWDVILFPFFFPSREEKRRRRIVPVRELLS